MPTKYEVLSGKSNKRISTPFSLDPLPALPDIEGEADDLEREFYNRIGTSLIAAKQLREVDLPSLRIAAFWYSACNRAMDAMRAGDGLTQMAKNNYKMASPYLQVLEKGSRALAQFANSYGLNLTSATKIPKAKSDRNSLDEMLK